MLDKLIFLLELAGLAVVFADVLVRDEKALLCPLIRWCRETYRAKAHKELDDQWWFWPLWGCPKCVAGQWGFWGYLIRYHAHYSLLEHLAFTAFTIIAAILLSKWTQDN